jgi:hypothetical protein
MTQSVSNGAHRPHREFSCSEVSGDEARGFTCTETHSPCASKRAERAAHPPLDIDDVPWALAYCRAADTVVEGFLCSERVVVSDACRNPNNAFDAFVCDEPRMKRLQWALLSETWSIVKSIALSLVRAKP